SAKNPLPRPRRPAPTPARAPPYPPVEASLRYRRIPSACPHAERRTVATIETHSRQACPARRTCRRRHSPAHRRYTSPLATAAARERTPVPARELRPWAEGSTSSRKPAAPPAWRAAPPPERAPRSTNRARRERARCPRVASRFPSRVSEGPRRRRLRFPPPRAAWRAVLPVAEPRADRTPQKHPDTPRRPRADRHRVPFPSPSARAGAPL